MKRRSPKVSGKVPTGVGQLDVDGETKGEEDVIVSCFTEAMLHSLVATYGIPRLVPRPSSAEDEPGEVPMDQLIAECNRSVPQLIPHCTRFDEYPTDALAIRNTAPSCDFLAHTVHMKKIFKLLHSKAAVELMVHRVGNTIVLDGVLDHFVDSWAVQVGVAVHRSC